MLPLPCQLQSLPRWGTSRCLLCAVLSTTQPRRRQQRKWPSNQAMQHHDAWFIYPASSVTSNSRERFIYHFLHLQRDAGDNRLFLLCTCTKPGCIVHILGRYGSTEAHTYTQRCKPLSGVFVRDKAMGSSSLLKRGAGMSHVKHTKQQQQKSFNNIHTENWCI